MNEWFLRLFTWPTGQMLVMLTKIRKISSMSGVEGKRTRNSGHVVTKIHISLPTILIILPFPKFFLTPPYSLQKKGSKEKQKQNGGIWAF